MSAYDGIKGITTPRVWTPPLRELTPETSLGFMVIEFARDVLHVNLVPWQEWLFIHALEIVGDFNGDWRFRFRKIVVMVARQQGKTLMSVILSAFFLYVLQVALVLGTSLDLSKAEEVWMELVNISRTNPELNEEIDKVSQTNGNKQLILKGYRRYKIAAITGNAASHGGRGDSNDLVILDELREHKTWAAWSATTKSTNARPRGMVWCFTNAGTPESIVLRTLRAKAHMRLGDPDGVAAQVLDSLPPLPEGVEEDDTLGWFEWSAPPKCSIYDIEAHRQANPSLGYGFIEERTIMSDAQTDEEGLFRTEVLCQFVDAIIQGPFPEGSWELGMDEKSAIYDGAHVYFGIDTSFDRKYTAIAACGMRSDGEWHVEVVAYRPGIDWAIDWIRERHTDEQPISVAWQGNGATISSVGDRFKSIPNLDYFEAKGGDLTAFHGRFYDSVITLMDDAEIEAVPVHHLPQPALDIAAKVAQKRSVGDGSWLFDRKSSPQDISPLMACVMAYGMATSEATYKPPKIAPSAYNEPGHDLLFI